MVTRVSAVRHAASVQGARQAAGGVEGCCRAHAITPPWAACPPCSTGHARGIPQVQQAHHVIASVRDEQAVIGACQCKAQGGAKGGSRGSAICAAGRIPPRQRGRHATAAHNIANAIPCSHQGVAQGVHSQGANGGIAGGGQQPRAIGSKGAAIASQRHELLLLEAQGAQRQREDGGIGGGCEAEEEGGGSKAIARAARQCGEQRGGQGPTPAPTAHAHCGHIPGHSSAQHLCTEAWGGAEARAGAAHWRRCAPAAVGPRCAQRASGGGGGSVAGAARGRAGAGRAGSSRGGPS